MIHRNACLLLSVMPYFRRYLAQPYSHPKLRSTVETHPVNMRILDSMSLYMETHTMNARDRKALCSPFIWALLYRKCQHTNALLRRLLSFWISFRVYRCTSVFILIYICFSFMLNIRFHFYVHRFVSDENRF